jgi:site-specific recombinase XerD
MNSTANSILKETIKRIEGAYAPSTIRAYRSNFERFICFCEEINQSALPANISMITAYIRDLSESNIKSATWTSPISVDI